MNVVKGQRRFPRSHHAPPRAFSFPGVGRRRYQMPQRFVWDFLRVLMARSPTGKPGRTPPSA